MEKKRVVITGGHLTPALAVIDELVKNGGWQIFFFGRRQSTGADKTPSVESRVIPEKGIPFIPIRTGKFQRRLTWSSFLSLLRIPGGFPQAFYHLLRIKPAVVLSFGGYLSVPVVFSAWLLRIPVVTHEQTTVRGLATRLNSYFAKKIAVSWPQTVEFFPAEKVVVTGNPIRKEVFKINEKIWQVLDYPQGEPLIFITGGNQGSHRINLVIEKALPQLLKNYNVFHQCGQLNAMGDFERLEKIREKLKPELKRNYHVKKYLSGVEMGTLLNKATLVISRAGANTINELVALGKTAILIPIPWLYQDEQTKNAQMLAEMGLVEILNEQQLDSSRLLKLVAKVLADIDSYQKQARQAQKTVKHDAAKKIASLVKEVAR